MSQADRVIAELQLQYQQFTAGMKDVQTQLERLDGKVDTTFAKMATESKDAFNQISASAKGLNLEALSGRLSDLQSVASNVFNAPLQSSASFETQMLKIQSLSGASKEQIGALGEQLKGLTQEMGIAVQPTAAAAVQYEILSSGFTDVASSSEVLRHSLKLTGGDAAQAGISAKALAGSLNAYGLGADQAARFTDVLFKTQDLGVTTVQELSAGLGQVTSISAQAGVSFEELNAAIAASTQSGQSTSTAIAGIRGIISTLLKPTSEAEKAMAKLGLTVNANTLKNDGLLKTLQKIRTATSGNNAEFVKIIGSQEAMSTALALVGDGGAKFASALTDLGNAAGSADKANAVLAQGFEATRARFDAAKDAFLIGVGQTILPLATKAVQAGADMFVAFDKIPAPIKAAGVGLAGLVSVLTGGLAAFVLYRSVASQAALALVDLGTRGGVLARGVVKLLTTEFVLNTTATKSNTAATVANAGSADLATAARARLTAANVAFTSSALAQRLALLGVVGAVAALALGFQAYIVELEKANAAQEELLAADDLKKKGRQVQNIKADDIVGKTAEELNKAGVTSDTIAQRILDERNRSAIAREAQNEEQLKKSEARTRELIRLQRELFDLRNKPQPGEAAATPSIPGASADPTEDQLKAQKHLADERYKDSLQEIELSKKTATEKIRLLTALRSEYSADGDKRRSITEKIASEEEKIAKAAADKRKKALDEQLKADLQKADNFKASGSDPDEAKLQILQKLLSKYKDNADARRDIEDRIFQEEQRLQKQREDSVKKLADLKADAAERELTALERQKAKLDELEGRGVDVGAARKAVLGTERSARIEKIDVQLEGDLAKEKDSKVRAALKKAAVAEKQAIEEEAAQESERIQRENSARILDIERDLAQRQQSILTNRLDLLRQAAEQGKNVESLQRQAIEQRLKLQERELQLQAELAKRQTDDPRLIALIEGEAQDKIRAARAAANEELDKANKLREAQKKGSSSKEFGGQILTLDQFLQGEKNRFADDPAKKRPASVKDVFNAGSVDRALLEARPALKPEQLGGAFASVAASPQQLNLRQELVLIDGKTGEQIPFETKRVTLNGRNQEDLRGLSRGAL